MGSVANGNHAHQLAGRRANVVIELWGGDVSCNALGLKRKQKTFCT